MRADSVRPARLVSAAGPLSVLRLGLILRVLLAFALAVATPFAAAAGPVLLLSPNMGKSSQQAKFQAAIAALADAGIEAHARFADELKPEQAREEFGRYRLVVFDSLAGPEMLSSLIPDYGPAIRAHPQLVAVAAGLPGSALSQRAPGGAEEAVHAYLDNGGRENFRRLAQYVRVHLLGQPAAGGTVQPALAFPKEAVYHPDAPQLVFADTASYLAWRAPPTGRPLVGVAFHRNQLAADSMAPVDATIRALEARGLTALAYYTDIAQDYLGERFVLRDGKPLVSVLVTHQVMLLNAEKVREQASHIGVPILHALHYRDGDVDAWQKDRSGIHLTQLPMSIVMPEIIGYADPLIVAAQDARTRRMEAIPAQIDALAGKAAGLARLSTLPNAEKRVAVFFYNYPPGVSNMGAAFLDVPASLAGLASAMRTHGYQATTHDAEWFEKNAWSTLRLFYSHDFARDARALLDEGRAVLFPVAEYRRWYDALPPEVRTDIESRWGRPEASRMVLSVDGRRQFVIPRIELGKLLVLPQPRRGEVESGKDEAQLYHDVRVPINHAYLATYLWLRERQKIDALVHLGTHGTQEWLKGKERGLSVHDDPLLVLGDTPVVYPYIADNLAEGMQAKRRGRAVLVSHMTPPFAVTGTFNEMSEVMQLINQYETAGVESLKDKAFRTLLEKAAQARLDKDTGWDEARARQDPAGYVAALQDFLLGLSNQAQPLGSHVLGRLPQRDHMVSTLALMLGNGFRTAADGEHALQAQDYTAFRTSRAARLLADHVIDGKDLATVDDDVLRAHLERARTYYARFRASDEIGGVLAALDARHLATGYGGDVVRNPDLLPTGRNMYAFDPSKVPTRVAWETGRKLAERTLEDYREKHGRYPDKLAFSLWSLETMRHFGVMEAQILALMGVRPVWNEEGALNAQLREGVRSRLGFLPEPVAGALARQVTGERLISLVDMLPESMARRVPLERLKAAQNFGRDSIVGVEIIPSAELRRPRVDVIVSATGLYRDTFPAPMKRIAEAAQKVAELEGDDNPLRRNALALRAALEAQGLDVDTARRLSVVRIFSGEPGAYSNGLSDATSASSSWERDDKLARSYMERMGYYYGTDDADWGKKRPGLDLYARNLAGTDAVLFSRSTNLYGLLTSDDPFGYFGSMSLAVRTVSGRTPDGLIANLRDPERPVMEATSRFMAKELKGRYFHPQWVGAQRDQGYAGTLTVLEAVENFWGWQVVDPGSVRDDQWQEFHDVYVRDKLGMGVRDWFEQKNPRALAQVAERMLEAARKGYWRTDASTLKELVEVVEDATRRHDFQPLNEKVPEFVEQLRAHGFGLDFVAPAPARLAVQAEAPKPVQGQKLEKQKPPPAAPPPVPWLDLAMLGVLATLFLAGVLRQASIRAAVVPPLHAPWLVAAG